MAKDTKAGADRRRQAGPRRGRAAPEVYVVLDALGAGRVLGVFEDADVAQRIVAADPSYCEVVVCRLNQVMPGAAAWAEKDPQRRALREALARLKEG